MGSEELLDWLFERQRVGMRPGLSRVRALLDHLGNPERSFDTVLVAGTNGKGSTAAALASCLTAAGRRTGRFTSPHLERVTERFVVDGEELPFDRLASALLGLQAEADRLEASFFEITAAVAMKLFADAGVECAVVEVGLGGRLDATNVLEPVLSLITEISLDHTRTLGSTVAAIAREKAGILRGGVQAVTSARGEALTTIREVAAALGTPLSDLEGVRSAVRDLGWEGLELELEGWGRQIVVRTPAVGLHQVRNQALAVASAWALDLPERAIVAGLRLSRWPGRLERFCYRGRQVILDGAHNPAAAGTVVRTLARLLPSGFTLVLGLTAGKDALGVIGPLAGAARKVVFTRATSGSRGVEPEALAELWPAAEVVADPVRALAAATESTPSGGSVVVAGSLYLVGALRSVLTPGGALSVD